jgi:hypothetical protein
MADKLAEYKIKGGDAWKPGAVVKCTLVLPTLAFTCYHFYEMARREDALERKCAIIGQTTCMVQYLGRVAYMRTLFVENVERREFRRQCMGLQTSCLRGRKRGSHLSSETN